MNSKNLQSPGNVMSMWKRPLQKALILGMLAVAWFSQAATEIKNPIESNSFMALIDGLAVAVRTVAEPLAILAIVFAGFRFVSASASGNQKGVTEARNMLVWILVGTAIIVGGSYLATAVSNTIQNVVK